MVPFIERHKILIRRAYWFVSIAGGLAVTPHLREMELVPQLLCLLPWLTVVAAGAVGINVLWFRQLAGAVDALGPLQATDPDRYIDGINALLEHQKSRQLQNLRLINLSAAYTAKRDYQTAKALLEQVPAERLAPALRCVYWSDLAFDRFLLGETDAALAVMDAQKALFDANRDAGQSARVISLLDIFEAVARNEPETAKTLLEQARRRWTDSDSAAYYGEVEKILNGPDAEPMA